MSEEYILTQGAVSKYKILLQEQGKRPFLRKECTPMVLDWRKKGRLTQILDKRCILKQPLRPGQGFSPELSRLVEQPAPKRKKSRKRRPLPIPARSARLYVGIEPGMVHMFRFFLETEDNLGIMTVVDRWRAVLLIRYSPHQERQMREFLDDVGMSLPISVVEKTIRVR